MFHCVPLQREDDQECVCVSAFVLPPLPCLPGSGGDGGGGSGSSSGGAGLTLWLTSRPSLPPCTSSGNICINTTFSQTMWPLPPAGYTEA